MDVDDHKRSQNGETVGDEFFDSVESNSRVCHGTSLTGGSDSLSQVVGKLVKFRSKYGPETSPTSDCSTDA
jgi:hypothetical protein